MLAGVVEIQMLTDLAAIKANLDRATGMFGNAMGNIEKMVGLASKAFVAFAGVASVGAFAGMIKGSIDAAAAFHDLAIQTGASVEALSEFNEIGKLSGVSADTIGGAMNKMAKGMAVANEESKGVAQAIKALGLDFNTFKNMKPDEQMVALAKAMDGFADGSGKSAVAMTLLGKEGAKLLPFMKDLATAQEIVGKVTKEQAAMADEFGDNLTVLRINGEEWKRTLSLGILPAMNTFLKVFVDSKTGVGGLRDEIKRLADDGSLERWAYNSITGITYLMDMLERVGGTLRIVYLAVEAVVKDTGAIISAIGLSMNALRNFDFSGAAEAWSISLEDMSKRSKDFNKELDHFWNAPLKGAQIREAMLVERIRAMADLATTVPDKPNVNFDGGDGKTKVDAQTKAYADLIASIKEKIAANELEAQVGRKLTEAEKEQLEISKMVEKGTLRAADAESELTKRMLDGLDVSEKTKDARQAEAKALIASAQANEKYITSLMEGLDKLKADTKAMEGHNQQLGLSKQAIAELEAAKLEEQATTLEGIAIKRLDRDLDEGAYNLLKAQSEELRKQAILKRSGAATEAAIEEAAKIKSEFDKTAESINNSLTDALLRGFESGKGFAENFRDTLKNMFKTLVLRPIIQGILAPVSGTIANAFGVNGGGVGGLVNGASNLYSAYGAFTQFMSGGSAGASAASLGYANAVGAMGGDSLGALISANGGWAGVSAGTAANGLAGPVLSKAALDGTASFGANSVVGGGLGGNLASLGPYALIAAFILKGASMMKGETRSGGQYGFSFDGSTAYSNRRGRNVTANGVGATFLEGPSGGVLKDEQGNDLGAALVNATVGNINSLFKNLGTNISITGFNAGFESSGNGRGGVFSGGQLSTGALFGESGQGDNYKGTLFEQWLQNGLTTTALGTKEAFAAFGVDMQGVVIQALQAGANMGAKTVVSQVEDWVPAGQDGGNFVPRDVFTRVFDETAQELETIPKTIRDMIRGVDVEGMKDQEVTDLFNKINATVQAVTNLDALLKSMPMDLLAKQSFDVKHALIEIAGGVEVLAGNLGTYYQNFYSEDERLAQATKNMASAFEALGVPMIDLSHGGEQARAAFRALVESQDLTTESGQKAYAGLLALSGAFAEITPAAEQAAQSMGDVADAMEGLKEATDAAFDALEKSVSASRSAAQEVATELEKVFAMLGANARDLYGQVESTSSTNAQRGSSFITKALATARATGYLPDSEELSQAISDARGGLTGGSKSQQDLDFERLKIAGELKALQEIAEPQLTAAEQQLQYLDDILENARNQLDALRGIDTSVLSVADALDRFHKAMVDEGKAAEKPTQPGGAVFGGSNPASPTFAAAESSAKYKRSMYMGTVGWANQDVVDPTEVAGLDALSSIYHQFDNTGNLVGLLDAVKGGGYSLSDLQAVTGFGYTDWLAAAEGVGYPKFERGTNYVEQEGFAYLHRGEEVAPARAVAGWRDESGATYQLLRSIDERLSKIEVSSSETSTNTKLSGETLDGASKGGRPLHVQVVPV